MLFVLNATPIHWNRVNLFLVDASMILEGKPQSVRK